MPTYIILGKFTQKGIENIKDHPKRLANSRKLAESLGGKSGDFYFTLGQYDFVSIVEAPNNETALQGLLTIGGVGSVRTETLVAIHSDKAAEIIKKLP